MFSTLENSTENRKRRSLTFVCGFCAQALLVVLAVLFGLLFPQELPVTAKQYVLIMLPSLTPPPAPVAKPAPKLARVVLPRMKPPVIPAPPVLVAAKVEIPKLRPTAPPITVNVPQLPAPPPMPSFVPPSPAPKVQEKVQAEVRTGNFGGAPEPVTTKRPANQVQTGGFGDPQGFKGQAKGESAGNVPKLGAFGLPDGPGYGNGTGGRHGVQGVVASAGFGSGIAGPGYGRRGSGEPVIATGSFEKVAQVAQYPLKTAVAPPPVDFQGVEILSKPTPVYTAEARRLGIEGDVGVSVIFQANGTLRVLAIVKSLGHGLDEVAEKAASQIHFKPAQRNGKPVDFPATVRIEFRLADQTT